VTIDIQLYSGKDMEPEIETLGEFRLRYFREFPYLYVGTKENEQGHLAEYLANPSARLLIARDGEKTIGVGIGSMLSTEKEILEQTAEAFRQHDWNPSDFFYFGEMIFTPEYRGRGIGKQMLDMLKKAGIEQDATRFCFLAVDRADDDPGKPPEHLDSATIFQKFGFTKTSIPVVFEWPTIQPDGSIEKAANTLSFWVDSIQYHA
jgi:ribosomal protein S18 acetylase RimI-like enzyme